MRERWQQFMRSLRDAFDGEPGSIFWLIKMAYRAAKGAVAGINGWLAVRRAQRASRQAQWDDEGAFEGEATEAEVEAEADVEQAAGADDEHAAEQMR